MHSDLKLAGFDSQGKRRRWYQPVLVTIVGALLGVVLISAGILPSPLARLQQRTPTGSGMEGDKRLLVLRQEPSPTTGAPIANIWLVHADGTGLRRITNEPAGVIDYTVAPDGTEMAYTAPDGLAATVIWRIGIDATNRVRLTSVADPAAYSNPTWSPVGNRILYVRRDLPPQSSASFTNSPQPTKDEDDITPAIWMMTPEGSSPRRIYGGIDGEAGEAPVWSPDGTHAAFQESFPQLYRHAIVITDLATPPIKVPTGFVGRISWSPDNQSLAFDEIFTAGKGSRQIVMIRADGSGRMTFFAAGEDRTDSAPTWSPDGQSLVFVRRDASALPAGALTPISDIWRATRDGSNPHRVVGGDRRTSDDLSWSPDGKLIAAIRYPVSNPSERGIWVVNADGTHAHVLIMGATGATWLPQA